MFVSAVIDLTPMTATFLEPYIFVSLGMMRWRRVIADGGAKNPNSRMAKLERRSKTA